MTIRWGSTDYARLGSALGSVQAMECRSENVDKAIELLSYELKKIESHDASTPQETSCDSRDGDTALFLEAVANLISEVDNMQQKIRGLRFDLEFEKSKAERRKKSIADLSRRVDRKQDRRKWWFS